MARPRQVLKGPWFGMCWRGRGTRGTLHTQGTSPMTIVERALESVMDGSRIGLGTGHTAEAFVKALGERVRNARLRVYAVPTSKQTATLCMQQDIPLLSLGDAGILDLTIDGAD